MGRDMTEEGTRQKRLVALSSVLAAVFLTVLKLVVGLATNSLGILSEAAHSALDMGAAVVTFFAVRISDRPPDREHQFGHGKIESLAAFVETILLLVTCIWIIYEAFERLLFKETHVVASAWAFLVMGISIVIDMGRSKALSHVARKYKSQALEADALHFRTDIWSSSVVIVGLLLVRLSDLLPQHRTWLVRADAVAALLVAGIVISVSIKLGKRTIDAVLDRAPMGDEARIREAISRVEHVRECSRLRLRTSGAVTFVEATVRVDPNLPVGLGHDVTKKIEESVAGVLPFSDVFVHLEPTAAPEEDIPARIRALAAQFGLSVHDIHSHRLEDGYHVDLDLVISHDFSLEKSHDVATRFEETLRRQMENLASVATHIEVPPAFSSADGRDITSSHPDLVGEVRALAEAHEKVASCHEIRVRQVGDDLYVSLHCLCAGSLAMGEAHRYSTEIESRLRVAMPQVAHFLVHIEPS